MQSVPSVQNWKVCLSLRGLQGPLQIDTIIHATIKEKEKRRKYKCKRIKHQSDLVRIVTVIHHSADKFALLPPSLNESVNRS